MIKKIKLHNFRSYSDLTLDINDRHLILIGHNGMGKTTIIEAILFAITNKQLKGNKINLLKKGTNNFYVEIELEHRGYKYIIRNGGTKQGVKNVSIKSKSYIKIIDKNGNIKHEVDRTDDVYKLINSELINTKLFEDIIVQTKPTLLMELPTSKRIELFDSLTIDHYNFPNKLQTIKEINKEYEIEVDDSYINQNRLEYINNIKSYKNDIKKYKSDIRKIQQDKDIIQQDLDKMTKNLNTIKSKIDKHRERLDKLYNIKHIIQDINHINDKLEEINKTENQKEELLKELDELRKLHKTKLDKMKSYQNEIDKIASILISTQRMRINKIKQETIELDKEFNKINEEIQHIDRKIQTYKNNNDMLEKLYKQINETIKNINNINHEIKLIDDELKIDQEKFKELKKYNVVKIDILDENKFLELEFCPLCNRKLTKDELIRHKDEIIKHQGELNAISSKIDKLKTSRSNLKAKLNIYKENLSTYREEIKILEEKINEINVDKLINNMGSLKECIDEINNKNNELQNKINKAFIIIEKIKERYITNDIIEMKPAKSKDEYKSLNEKLKELYNEYKEKYDKQNIVKTETNIKNIQQQIDGINERLKEKDELINKKKIYENKLKKIPFDINNIDGMINKIKQEIDDLQKDQINIEQNIETIRHKLNDINSELTYIKTTIKNNMKNIDYYKTKLAELREIKRNNKKIIKIKNSLSKIEEILDKKNLPSLIRKEILKIINVKFQQLHGIFGFDFIPYIDENISFDNWNDLSGAQELTFSLSLLYALKDTLIPDFPLFIIDEPTNRMDDTRVIMLKEFFTNLSKTDTQLIIATHNISLADIDGAMVFNVENR